MGTISEKLTYLNTTKGKIKDVINMTGVGITNNTFRSYAQSLYDGYIATLQDKGTLLDNMNKGTSTGAISGSANLPVYEYKASKLSTQTTTTQSANLFDENYYKNATYGSNIYKYILTKIKGSGTLYKRCILKSGKSHIEGLYMCICSKQNPNISGATTLWFEINGAEPSSYYPASQDFSSVEEIYFSYYPSTITPQEIFDTYNIMVSTDNVNYTPFVPNSPSPDYPSEVNTVKGYRNLANIHNIDNTSTSTYKLSIVDDTIVLKDNTNAIGFSQTNKTLAQICPELQVGDIVTLSFKNTSSSGSANRIYLSGVNSAWYLSSPTKTITQDMLDSTVIVYGGHDETAIISEFMITKIANAPYVPYGSNYIYTTISDGTNSKIVTIPLNDNEICGIGDYKDELVIDKLGNAKLVKNIGKVVLDGSEDENFIATGLAFLYSTYLGSTTGNVLSNRFIYSTSWTSSDDKYRGKMNISADRIRFMLTDITITTTEQLKTWLSNNNVNFYYALATPTEIDLGTVDMELYEGTNNITNSEDMDMSIKYIKDTYE